jgi:hypothetical protein
MKLRLTVYLLAAYFAVGQFAFALTPSERDTLKQVQAYVRQGQVEYNAAMESAAEADQRAADAYAQASLAKQHADDTDKAVGVVKKQIDDAHNREVALKKDNDKMKPVYDQVNSKWGLGAFAYGFKVLSRHLLIMAAVIIVLIIGCVIAAAIFPEVLVPIFAGIFHVIGIVFHIIGYFVDKGLRAIAMLFRKSPPPTPPLSMPTTQAVPPPNTTPAPAPAPATQPATPPPAA